MVELEWKQPTNAQVIIVQHTCYKYIAQVFRIRQQHALLLFFFLLLFVTITVFFLKKKSKIFLCVKKPKKKNYILIHFSESKTKKKNNMVVELLVGLIIFTILVNNQAPKTTNSCNKTSVLMRHANFDMIRYQTMLSETAWHMDRVNLVWVDNRSPFVEFENKLPIHETHSAMIYVCGDKLVVMSEIVRQMRLSSQSSHLFATMIDVKLPSLSCDHMLLFTALDQPSFQTRKHQNLTIPAITMCNNLPVAIIQDKIAQHAQTKYDINLQWTLQTITNRTIRTDINCTTTDSTLYDACDTMITSCDMTNRFITKWHFIVNVKKKSKKKNLKKSAVCVFIGFLFFFKKKNPKSQQKSVIFFFLFSHQDNQKKKDVIARIN